MFFFIRIFFYEIKKKKIFLNGVLFIIVVIYMTILHSAGQSRNRDLFDYILNTLKIDYKLVDVFDFFF